MELNGEKGFNIHLGESKIWKHLHNCHTAICWCLVIMDIPTWILMPNTCCWL